MCDTQTLVPIPDHMADYADDEHFRPGPEFGVDAQGRRCFLIDTCIVPALLAVWEAGEDARARGAHGDKALGAMDVARETERWQQANGHKTPD